MQNRDEGLVSPSDIADMAGVSRGAVSNWRKRDGSFPRPVAGSATKPLFSLADVSAWLEATGKQTTGPRVEEPRADAMEVWAALNLLRGVIPAEEIAELVLEVATSVTDADHVDFDDARIPPDILEQVVRVIDKTDRTDLGKIADFALERLARSQGKMGADLGFIGSRTTTLLANFASRLDGGVLYDPACGIAAALLEAVRLGAKPARIIGHDINPRALRIASQRAELRGVELELAQTNVLAEDFDPALRADVIILEPPFGVRLDGTARLTDARFDFGAPPRSSADTAWLQHAVAHLADGGRAYVLSPMGTLFRSGEEVRIRAELIRHGCVEAIVGLPGRLLPHTSIPLALWVLRRPVPEAAIGTVLFIDATETVAPEHNVATWLADANARENVPHAVVAITDVLAAESLLTPQRWVDRAEREPSEVAEAYRQGWSAITDTVRELHNVLTTSEHLPSFSKPRIMTVSELIDQGVLDLRMGRPKVGYDKAPAELQERMVTASDVRDGTLRELGIDTEHDDYPGLTLQGDVLVTTMNTIRARVDNVGGHLPSTGVYRLRVLDWEVLSPGYLAIALCGTWNDRFKGGTTIQRASIKDLEIPLVPLTEQRDIQLAMLSIQLLHDQSAHLAEEASTVRTALLDAVRYNARLAKPAPSVGTTHQDDLNDYEGAK